eukprot:TRINITY_DN12072_c0_g1_i2.p1 TRINITY_DN12072_c0_g1~~TRINITY_DN12072_c0_g1_i2.p1  ORF type:complete len:452 (+),score=106.43 TRINITY_DN12072_c0_g1_i2:74-1357(+)
MSAAQGGAVLPALAAGLAAGLGITLLLRSARLSKHTAERARARIVRHEHFHTARSAAQAAAPSGVLLTPLTALPPAPGPAPAPAPALVRADAPPSTLPPTPTPAPTPRPPPAPIRWAVHPPVTEADCKGLQRIRIRYGFYLAVDPTSRSFTEGVLLKDHQWETDVVANMEQAAVQLERSGARLADLRYYDVGCNMAYYSLWAATRGFGEVHCFEPMRENLRKIRCALSYNSPTTASRIHVHPYAAGPRRLSCAIYSPPENPNDGKLACGKGTPPGWETVEIRRVDSLVHDPPDVLKMDVEGFEPGAADGMSSLLANASTPPWSRGYGGPAFVFTEFFGRMVAEHGVEPAKFLRSWDQRGYVITRSALGLCGPCVSPHHFSRLVHSHGIDNLVLARPPFAHKTSMVPPMPPVGYFRKRSVGRRTTYTR